MRQRGRKSLNEVALNVIDCERASLAAPAFLTKAEALIFVALATSVSHLRAVDAPMLASLAQAIALTHRLARNPKRIAEWERAARIDRPKPTVGSRALPDVS
jgi:hypothetical protein